MVIDQSIGYQFSIEQKGGPGSGIEGHRTFRNPSLSQLLAEKTRRLNNQRRGHLGNLRKIDEQIESIEKATEMSKDEAKIALNKIHFYANGGYVDIRNGNDKKGISILEGFIEKSPKWDNSSPLYRGINVGFDFFKKLKVGAKVNMKGISSWSSEINTAKDFAKFSGKKAKVVFRLSTTDLATPIAHLSEGGKQYASKEILLSGKSQLSIKTWEQKGSVVYIDVNELQQKQFSFDVKSKISSGEKPSKAISIIERWEMDSNIVEIAI